MTEKVGEWGKYAKEKYNQKNESFCCINHGKKLPDGNRKSMLSCPLKILSVPTGKVNILNTYSYRIDFFIPNRHLFVT